jgi:LmbE family N-acetylglucosaminyl deacetylase
MSRKFLTFLLLLPVVLFAQAPKSLSSSEILLQLKKLKTVGSVLYIAAHPDDENTRLIAYLANEKCLRTGYLSLTRGDGGQNLIGPEQGVELGLIRTQELLAARRTDGGEQFFTRAYDFGYSKTPEETFEKWNHDSILADVVWVIRKFRPDIIITRFATDGSGGHGHHTASGILAEEAFDAAADPNRFKEQLKSVDVWQAKRLLYNTTARFRDPNADMSKYIKLDVGLYNVYLGKSYGEIAAESRSMHKSQGFGSARQRGEYFEHFKPVKGDTANLKDIFDRLDFTWNRVPEGKAIGKLIDQCIAKYNVNKPSDLQPLLTKINDELIFKKLTNTYSYKMDLVYKLLANSMGLVVDITCNESTISSGAPHKITFSAVNRSDKSLKIAKILFPAKYKQGSADFFDTTVNLVLNPNQMFTFSTWINPSFQSNDKKISQPYWLQKMPKGFFQVNKQSEIGSAEIPFLASAMVIGYFKDNSLFSENYPIQYRWVDPEKGELYRPLVITPPVILKIQNEVYAFSDMNSKEVKVSIKAYKDSLKGRLKLEIPSNWTSEPKEFVFELLRKGDESTYTFKMTPPSQTSQALVKAVAEIYGELFSKGIREIKYDHIPVQTWFPEAESKLIKLEVNISKKKIGYIPGAGDEVQACLSQIGYDVTTITDAMLQNEDISRYDAILTGVRAFNTNDLLFAKKQKLMDYVKNGGNLIVQYNTNSFVGPVKSDLGPYPFKITRDRNTDENSNVIFDLPNHPLLNTPNKINSTDFDGWVQERGIYFAGSIDSVYQCPISLQDKGEKPNKGSLIIAKHGKGNFIYTGLVFFRELPAGVPGAYRLMVNMIELKN